ncbi:hypothetical protein FSP39_011963 [Pinctada imbricata]|uniref:Dynein light chain n=1 Tax=Pinctada imbricata TaxID=66713 RepID=A0AA88XNE0_PINIB|nr:hypothetical protein FSP39_011963 [Pinctada imbricata]
MSERKAVIKNADMAEDTQQDPVDCATQALEKYNIEKDIAAFIKRNSTKSTTQPGTALLDATLVVTSHMKPSISSTSTLDRLPFFCSNKN